MRPNINDVEIQEPPINEIHKQRSCLKRSCVTGCGCIVLFIIGGLLILYFTVVSRPKEIKHLPDHVEQVVSVYDKDSITNIYFIEGEKKSRATEIAAFFPKLILSPIILTLDDTIGKQRHVDENGQVSVEKYSGWSEFVALMREPVTDARDVYQIEWTALPAEPSFVEEHYAKQLREKGFVMATEETETTRESLTLFSHMTRDIDLKLYIDDNPNERGTDYLTLTIHIP